MAQKDPGRLKNKDDNEIKKLHDEVNSLRIEVRNKDNELKAQKEALRIQTEALETRLEEFRCTGEKLEKANEELKIRVLERKQAEEAARASDVRFRSLIQNSSDIIRILDKEGRIIYDSQSSERILGYPPGHMLGISPLEYIHPDDREQVRLIIRIVFYNNSYN